MSNVAKNRNIHIHFSIIAKRQIIVTIDTEIL